MLTVPGCDACTGKTCTMDEFRMPDNPMSAKGQHTLTPSRRDSADTHEHARSCVSRLIAARARGGGLRCMTLCVKTKP